MKQIIYLLLSLVFMVPCASCGDNDEARQPEVVPPGTDIPSGAKTLVVYYSFTNNVERVVDNLKTQISVDVCEVEPAEDGVDYSANNYSVGSAQIAAIRRNPNDASSYPAIKPLDVDFDKYDVVIIATPLWSAQMASPMQSFLFRNGEQMAGKHVGLIVSSASTGISGVEADAKRLVPDGDFLSPSLWIRSSQTSSCHELISDWLETVGLGGNEGDSDGGDGDVEEPAAPVAGSTLIAYFSRWGNTDYPSDVDASTGASIQVSDGKRMGTTQMVAEFIRKAVGGDIHLIETSDRYPVDFDDVRDLNHAEQAAGTLPALKSKVDNIDRYETIFVGYPVWAVDVPLAIKSFLAAYDLRGKTVVPFCTHDGYGAGRSYATVGSASAGATVLDGLALLAGDVPASESVVTDWLDRIGIGAGQKVSRGISITVDGHVLSGEWFDTPLADEIRGMFPLTTTLGKYGGREYYGSMPQRPVNTETGQLTFENGDITYCPSNNTIAIFYGMADDPDMGRLTMRVIPVGKVTSDLTIFDQLASRLEFTFADR